jgi:tRNA(Ile)-lysidine synthase
MQGVEWIPDCYGIHGVHHSGGIQNPELGRRAVSNLPFPIEQGGIQVLRPLLGFDKSRLIKTCEENGIAWAEDATNHMPMTTTRNAVRHMIGNHKLPEALSNQSLVQLAQHVQERVRSHKDTANKVFDDCLMKFDMQTASLIARFPASDDFLGGRPIVTESDKIEARNTAYVFLQRLTGIISPMEVTSVGQLSNAIDYIYPALRLDDEGPDHAHTVCGVWFRPYDLPSPFESDDGIPTVNVMEYMLSRQPLDVTSKTAVSITIPPATLSSLSTHSTVSPPNDFHLFDGRFWIRVVNKTVNRNITLRTLTHADIAHINEQTKIPFFHSPLSSIKAALVLIRPGITRLTIPALFLEPDPESADSKDASPTLLALPTFNASVEDPETRIEEICEWEVRYKKVDFGSRAEDIVMPPRHLARQVKRERERMERTMYSMPMVDRKEIKKRKKLV